MKSWQNETLIFAPAPVYLTVGRHRLINLVTLERWTFYMVFGMLMIPLVLRRGVYIYTFDPFLGTLLILWSIRSIHRSDRQRQKQARSSKLRMRFADGLIILLMLWTLFSTVFSLNPTASILQWLLLMRGTLLYAYLRVNFGRVITIADVKRIIVALLMVETILALVQFATNSRIGSINDYFGSTETYANAYFRSSIGQVIRVVGTFHNPNLLADWIILLSPFIYAWIYFRIPIHPIFYYVLLLMAVFALLFTFSRSGWISFGAGVVIFIIRAVTLNVHPLTIRVNYVLKQWILLSLIIGAVILAGGYLSDVIDFTIIFDRFADATLSGSWRLAYVKLAYQFIEKFPLTGIGLDNFNQGISLYHEELYIPTILRYAQRYTTVHNVYLLFFAETGIIGGFIWFVLSVDVTVRSWRLPFRRANFNPYFCALAMWLLAAWIGFFINANFEAVFFHPSILMLIFAQISYITTLYDLTQNKRCIPVDLYQTSHPR